MDHTGRPPNSVCLFVALPYPGLVGVGNRRNIRTTSFCPMSASKFTTIQHFHHFTENGHFPVDLLEKGNERLDHIPGLSSTRVVDMINGRKSNMLGHILKAFSWVPKA
ncbi:hypothetical protein M0R45_017517 [Rubus argutus]|uniref:Uncharacterized protein n=1 Tax=Rubus argutus TaxID=59490 RepID=A0AAW1XVY3_RUBAR